ncbi:TPA: aromatic acid exporter family protein [Streptococcus pneumoniae]
MSISQRTTKLILATCLACLLAYFLNLSSAVSAGIIALLSLSDTRRSTLKLARNRLFSMLLALAIGTGFALLVNLYMPSREEEIQHYHTLVEEKLKDILQRFKYYLSRGDGRNRAQLVAELDTLLKEALRLVYLDHSDHLFHQTDYHIHYFEMRQRQSRILRNMAQQINTCHLAASESLILAQLFSKIAGQLSQTNPASDLLDEIERYLEVFRNRSLPKTREEFETRATLLQLLREAKTFIQVKVDFYQKYRQ